MSELILKTDGLQIKAPNGRTLVSEASFEVRSGECIAIVGPSGAGKTTSVLASLGLLSSRFGLSGCISWLDGPAVPASSSRPFRLGRDAVLLTQQPMEAFDPLIRIGRQIEETLEKAFPGTGKSEARSAILATLRRLGFDRPEDVIRRFPCELSGGMLQRCMTAIVRLLKPRLIVADEPTSALDILSSSSVLTELLGAQKETGAALIVITHDVASVLSIASRIYVVDRGNTVETLIPGNLAGAEHPASERLLSALRTLPEDRPALPPSSTPFIEVKDVRKTYAGPGFLFRGKVTNVLDRVSFTLKKGACTGLIGLSGAGKSTLSRILLGLEKADSGQVLFDGVTVHAWKKAHPGSLSIVLQNYTDSVNPNKTVGEIIEEPLRIAGLNTGIQQRTEEMLSKVGLTEDFAARFPHELSGGELQRVCIARALAPAPRFIIFDEALSGLDAALQQDILQLLRSLKTPESTWLFITHDLTALRSICTDAVLLEDGRAALQIDTSAIDTSENPLLRQLASLFKEKSRLTAGLTLKGRP